MKYFCALLGALLAFARPATAAPIALPPATLSDHSGAKILRQLDGRNSLVGVQLVVRAGLDRQGATQSGLAALTAACIVRTAQDALLARGGSLSYTVDGNDIRFYLEGVKERFAGELLPVFEASLAHPKIDSASVNAARDDLDRKIHDNQKIPLTVGLEMLSAALITDSNAGMPQYGLPATLAGFTAADVAAFFARNYRRGGAIVSADGGLDAVPAPALNALIDTLADGSSSAVPAHIARLQGSQHRLIAHRDIAVPWLVAQFPAPPVTSKDFGAMLVLTSFLERTAAEVAENPSITTKGFAERAVGTFYNFDERPANLVLYINGGFGDPTRPFNTAMAVIQIFARSKLAGNIGQMKTIAAGSFVDGISSLEDRAWLAAVFASQSSSTDYVTAGLDAIGRVTPADLQRVARTYLENPNVAIILPRDVQSPT